jgi:hypothetical protein
MQYQRHTAGYVLLLSLLSGAAIQGQEAATQPAAEPGSPSHRSHWAFQQPVPRQPPQVRDNSWVANPIDSFVLARLEKIGLQPAPPANRTTLIRRVTFDLTGLPAAPEEVDSFVNDSRPDAYIRVVERLLASPHYGERWAQHWLDVVRYAESNGYEVDAERPHAWRYRDYVVDAFNKDMPYDQFVIEQLAGDLLMAGQEPRRNLSPLIACGFNRCGQIHLVAGNTDAEINRQEVLTEMTAGVGAAFLGLTVGCARCHDHKFDPISQADYYRLQAFFAGTQPREMDICGPQQKAVIEEQRKKLEEQIAPLRKKAEEMEKPYKTLLMQLKRSNLEAKYRDALDVDPKKRTPEQKKLAEQGENLTKVMWDEIVEALSPEERTQRAAWRAQIHALESQLPPPSAQAWTITEEDKPPATYILKRGDPKRRGREVQPAFLPVLLQSSDRVTASNRVAGAERFAGAESSKPRSDGQNRGIEHAAPATHENRRLKRLDLARWLTRPDHPLTARVMVNRLWQHQFGHGLVATSNDFGLHGDKPSHPELLDWLACEFVNNGWSIKHMHRLMVLSNTYQQASSVTRSEETAKAQRLDPNDRLLWRMNRQRLEGEALRDSALCVAGTFNPKIGGPMVRVPLEPEVYALIFTEGEPDNLWPVTPDAREHGRRSLYLFAKRTVRLPLLEAFDRPDMVTSCPVRPVSTFAPQALIMLNGPFMQEQSKALASRLLRECGPSVDKQIDRAYHLSLGRAPREAEMKMARDFLAEQTALIQDRLRARKPVGLPPDIPETVDPAAAAALPDFCLAILNRNEFLYVN